MGVERTRLVQSYQSSRGYQFQFVLSLNYLQDLLFGLIQSCSEQNETVERRDITHPTGKRFKASELVQSAQKMARYGSIKGWRRIRLLQEVNVCFIRNCTSRNCLSLTINLCINLGCVREWSCYVIIVKLKTCIARLFLLGFTKNFISPYQLSSLH